MTGSTGPKENAGTSHHTTDRDEARGIEKWARRYAQHRTLPVLVFYAVFLIMAAAIGIPSYFAGKTYRAGQMVWFGVCIAVLVPATALLIWLSVPWWGGKKLQEFALGLYGKEGLAGRFSFPERRKMPRWFPAVIGAFMVCVAGSVLLGFRGYLPDDYMQPISAIYCVPFLAFLIAWLRMPLLAWLWPVLYALHAILMVAGAPIRFAGSWQSLNMLLPTAGYGFLAAFIGHLYSRYALRKLKKLSRMDSSDGDRNTEAR